MNGYEKANPRSNRAIKRHKVIYNRFVELRAKKFEEDPIEARYLPVGYYADIIAEDPLIDLQPYTIVRIINSFIKGRRK